MIIEIKKYIVPVFLLALCLGLMPAEHTFAQEEAESLTITNVRVSETDANRNTATISWNTNLYSESLVVCGNASQSPFTYDESKPNFGYSWSTIRMTGLVMEHNVPLASLAKETQFCRALSRQYTGEAWVVSDEIVFSTGEMVIEEAKEEVTEEALMVSDEEVQEESKNGGVLGMFTTDGCNTNWMIWGLVLLMLLVVTRYSKDFITALTPSESVKRLYVVSGVSLLIFIIAVLGKVYAWIVPVGIGTMALLAATISDVVRAENSDSEERVSRISLIILSVLTVSLLLAFILKWSCALMPIAIVVIVLAVRHSFLEKTEEKTDDK